MASDTLSAPLGAAVGPRGQAMCCRGESTIRGGGSSAPALPRLAPLHPRGPPLLHSSCPTLLPASILAKSPGLHPVTFTFPSLITGRFSRTGPRPNASMSAQGARLSATRPGPFSDTKDCSWCCRWSLPFSSLCPRRELRCATCAVAQPCPVGWPKVLTVRLQESALSPKGGWGGCQPACPSPSAQPPPTAGPGPHQASARPDRPFLLPLLLFWVMG